MFLVLRAKVDAMSGYGGDDGPNVRYTAVRLADHSYADDNQNLLKHLQAYKTAPVETESMSMF